eukprot:6338418-Prymnesium_polylepis.1
MRTVPINWRSPRRRTRRNDDGTTGGRSGRGDRRRGGGRRDIGRALAGRARRHGLPSLAPGSQHERR